MPRSRGGNVSGARALQLTMLEDQLHAQLNLSRSPERQKMPQFPLLDPE